MLEKLKILKNLKYVKLKRKLTYEQLETIKKYCLEEYNEDFEIYYKNNKIYIKNNYNVDSYYIICVSKKLKLTKAIVSNIKPICKNYELEIYRIIDTIFFGKYELKKEDFNLLDMPSKTETYNLQSRLFTIEEFEKIKKGYVPIYWDFFSNDMIIIYFENNNLYFYSLYENECHCIINISKDLKLNNIIINKTINRTIVNGDYNKIINTMIDKYLLDIYYIKKEDWKTLDMPLENKIFNLNIQLTEKQFNKIKKGHLPECMEDKWFIYYENNKLYFHRSWTGYCIYIANICEDLKIESVIINIKDINKDNIENFSGKNYIEGLKDKFYALLDIYFK